ncbi:hypothetical protein [Azospirillum aestuarii]|uniref:hypothetical protein n=1 Tax=Azospirillum aestuarii TaxID=2802052 RepID=UPI004054DA23
MTDTSQPNDDAALYFDPFEGDYGGGETRIVDAIVTAPDPVRCHVCAGPIKPGTKVRRIVETCADLEDMPEDESQGVAVSDLRRYELGRSDYLICETCCDAARKDAEDGGERLDRRYSVGFNRRDKVGA